MPAQTSHQVFEHLSTEHGLSSNKVEAILQDREGFYWIATQNGLNRYDGNTFKVFRHDASDTTSLTHNHCTALVEGQDGDIWVATYKGVSRYNKTTGNFTRMTLRHPSGNFELANRIYNIAVDDAGDIWMSGTALWKYDTRASRMTSFVHSADDPASIPPGNLITSIVRDPARKGIWIALGEELCFYSLAAQRFYSQRYNPVAWNVFDLADGLKVALDNAHRVWFRDRESQMLASFDVGTNTVSLTSKELIADYGIKRICADAENKIWIFYWTIAAEILDPQTGSMSSDFFRKYHRYSALSERATNLFIDRHENYWIASDKGISIYHAKNQFYKLYQPRFTSGWTDDAGDWIKAFAQDRNGQMWIGTPRGLYFCTLSSGDCKQIDVPSPAASIYALCIAGDTLWIGTGQQLFAMHLPEQRYVLQRKLPKGYYSMHSGNGSLWLTYWQDGLYRYVPASGELRHYTPAQNNSTRGLRSHNLITGLAHQNAFWVGYNGGIGFSRLDTREEQWGHYHPHEKDISHSNAGTITVIAHDAEQSLWLGTHGAGIFYFDIQEGTYQNYQQEDGLNSNYINSILSGPAQSLWISTADGINYMHRGNHSIRSLDIDLTFPNNDHRSNGTYGTAGLLYFFNNTAIVEIDPTKYKPDTSHLPLVLTGFRVFDREVPLPPAQEIVRLSHRENFFAFTFSAVGTRPRSGIRYAYMLDGFDQNWHAAGHQRTANYTNVPGGDYVFQVRSTNEDGQWNPETLQLRLHITPPFWRTWWFFTLCGLLAAFAVSALHHYRVNQIKKIFSLRTQISRDLHDDIGASLSSINIYSTVAEAEVVENPQKAQEILQQIHQNSRQVMDNISDIVWANRITKTEDITISSRVKNYGYDLLSRKHIECLYRIDPYVDKKLTDPEARKNILLLIKEALNNIAKYSEASVAEVSILLDGRYVKVKVSDNGKGFDTRKVRPGNGLIHMKQRTEELDGTLEILSSERGTIVEARIPLANISDS